MPEPETRHRYRPPLFGIFLLFLGVILLLQNLGVLAWGLWRELWRFWPVLVIGGGFRVLLRDYNPWLSSLLFLVLLCASLGVAIWQYGFP